MNQRQLSSKNNIMPSRMSHNSSQLHDGGITLSELFGALWRGKTIIIASTILFAAIAVIYVLTAQQWWSSKARVMQPQLSEFAQLQQQVKQFKPIFDVYHEDGTVFISNELDHLVDPQILFQQFISEYNSSVNKVSFLNHSTQFNKIANKDTGTQYNHIKWINKIEATPVDTKLKKFDIKFQSTTKDSSYILLKEYVDSIKSIVFSRLLNNIETIVQTKQYELSQQKVILERQAKNHLELEIERSQYALEIAMSAEVHEPIQVLGDQDIFPIHLGSKILKEKIKALKSVTNFGVIEARLQNIDAKLEMLANIKVDKSIQFQTFHFLEDIKQPISRDKPKRAFIVLLGTLLGLMLGTFVVMVRFIYRKEKG